jgi:hypothetical protein
MTNLRTLIKIDEIPNFPRIHKRVFIEINFPEAEQSVEHVSHDSASLKMSLNLILLSHVFVSSNSALANKSAFP